MSRSAILLISCPDRTGLVAAITEFIFRNNGNQRTAAKFDLAAIRTGAGADPTLQAGDVIVVDQSGTRAALGRVLEALPLVGVFGTVLGS